MESRYRNTANDILRKIQSKSFEAYFVGGYVRDYLLNKITRNTEIDIATNATPQQLKTIFPKIKEVGQIFGVSLLIKNRIPFEIATFRQDISYSDGRHPDEVVFTSIAEDAKRRDLTINAIYMNINNEIIDPIGGQSDLKNKTIRFIGDPEKRINEDHLRIIRAIRFKNKLNFEYDKKTSEALLKYNSLTKKISPERINNELSKMLIDKSRSATFYDLLKLGILDQILPEVEKMSGIKQSSEYHAEGDVFVHTMLVLNSCKKIKRKEILWTLLLHDIGKADTQIVTDKIRFIGHQKNSVKKAKQVLKRLKFTRQKTSKICWLIENHMIMPNIEKMRQAKRYRFFSHKWFMDLLIIFKADISGSLPCNFEIYNNILKLYEKYKQNKPKLEKKLLTGNDIMKILNIPAGVKVGEVLDLLKDQVLEEKIHTKNEAVKFIINLITKP